MRYLNEDIRPDLISYQPAIKNIGASIFCLKCGLISIVLSFLTIIVFADSQIGGFFGLCAFVLIPAALFKIIFRNRTTLIFDATTRCIYKKKPGGKCRKVMAFDNVHSVSIESEHIFFFYEEFSYCLSDKNNIFGSGLVISPDFREGKYSKLRHAFEENILPAFEDMLQIGSI